MSTGGGSGRAEDKGIEPSWHQVPRGLADRPSEPISGYPPFRESSGIGIAWHIFKWTGIRRVVSATLRGFGLQCHRRATLTYHFPRSTGGDSGQAASATLVTFKWSRGESNPVTVCARDSANPLAVPCGRQKDELSACVLSAVINTDHRTLNRFRHLQRSSAKRVYNCEVRTPKRADTNRRTPGNHRCRYVGPES